MNKNDYKVKLFIEWRDLTDRYYRMKNTIKDLLCAESLPFSVKFWLSIQFISMWGYKLSLSKRYHNIVTKEEHAKILEVVNKPKVKNKK